MSKARIFVSILIMAVVTLAAVAVLALHEQKPASTPDDEASEGMLLPAGETAAADHLLRLG